MATQTAGADVKTAFDYILGRVTAYMDNRADYFRRFIEGGVKAEGWLAGEVYYALTGRLASEVIKIDAVRGRAQGDCDVKQPDLEVSIGNQSHQLYVKPCLITAQQGLDYHSQKGLAPVFEWANSLKERSAVLLVCFPQSNQDEAWKKAVAATEKQTGLKCIGQSEFFIPMPPKPLKFGCISLWRPGSVA